MHSGNVHASGGKSCRCALYLNVEGNRVWLADTLAQSGWGKGQSISVANGVTVDIVDSHMQKNMDWSVFFTVKPEHAWLKSFFPRYNKLEWIRIKSVRREMDSEAGGSWLKPRCGQIMEGLLEVGTGGWTPSEHCRGTLEQGIELPNPHMALALLENLGTHSGVSPIYSWERLQHPPLIPNGIKRSRKRTVVLHEDTFNGSEACGVYRCDRSVWWRY